MAEMCTHATRPAIPSPRIRASAQAGAAERAAERLIDWVQGGPASCIPGAEAAVILASRHLATLENPGGSARLIARSIARH